MHTQPNKHRIMGEAVIIYAQPECNLKQVNKRVEDAVKQ